MALRSPRFEPNYRDGGELTWQLQPVRIRYDVALENENLAACGASATRPKTYGTARIFAAADGISLPDSASRRMIATLLATVLPPITETKGNRR
jgi:hypothetical protein